MSKMRLCQNSILVQPPYARELLLYIRSLLSSFLGGGPFLRGLFFVEPVEKRFVCKEKRRTFVTAKAIPARLIEELFRRARRDSFFGGDQATSFFLSVSPEKRAD